MNNINHSSHGPDGHIVVMDKGTRYVLHLNTITHLESRRIYTIIHIKGKPCIVGSQNIGYYEKQLGDCGFFRIHRSHLINLYEVRSYSGQRGLKITLSDETQLQVSHLKKSSFIKTIEELARSSRRTS